MQLTPHFSLAEMCVTEHRAIDNMLVPGRPQDDQIIEHLKVVCQGLELIRDTTSGGTGVFSPIVVSSGFRCPALNTAIGASPTSHHVVGYAADFNIPGIDPFILAHEIKKGVDAGTLAQFDQLIYEHPVHSRWVHISFAPRLRGECLTIDRLGTHKGFVDNA